MITRKKREEITRDFLRRNGGVYDPAKFAEEVRTAGPAHPAYEWFNWDDADAAERYRVKQAREFVRDLRISFTVRTVSPQGPLVIRTTEAPLLLSPLDTRPTGGGYVAFDPGDANQMAGFCREAAEALDAWARRYRAAIEASAASFEEIERQSALLRLNQSEALAAE